MRQPQNNRSRVVSDRNTWSGSMLDDTRAVLRENGALNNTAISAGGGRPIDLIAADTVRAVTARVSCWRSAVLEVRASSPCGAFRCDRTVLGSCS